MHKWDYSPVSPGSRADRRLPIALREGYYGVAQGRLHDVFAAVGERACNIGASRRGPGLSANSLARAFRFEPAFAYAQIGAFDTASAARDYAIAAGHDPARAAVLLCELASGLSDWIDRLPSQSRTDRKGEFSKQLERLEKEVSLSARLQALAASGAGQVPKLFANGIFPAETLERKSGLARSRAIRAAMGAQHALMRNALETLGPLAIRAFDARIASGDMDPALGLLIAELGAAGDVREGINEFTERFIGFYYGDIVGQAPLGASAERVLLRLDQGKRSAALPEGTTLQAKSPDRPARRFCRARCFRPTTSTEGPPPGMS